MLLYRLCNGRLIFPKIASVFVSVRYKDVCSRKQPGNCVSAPNLESVHDVRLGQAFQIIRSAFGRCWKMVAFPVGESKLEYIILKLTCASNAAVKHCQCRPNIHFHFQLKVVFFLLNCCHGWCFILLMKCSLWPLFLKYQPQCEHGI